MISRKFVYSGVRIFEATSYLNKGPAGLQMKYKNMTFIKYHTYLKKIFFKKIAEAFNRFWPSFDSNKRVKLS
jgi:hypothetical protein